MSSFLSEIESNEMGKKENNVEYNFALKKLIRKARAH